MNRMLIFAALALSLIASFAEAGIRFKTVSGPDGNKAILIEGAANEEEGDMAEYAYLAKAFRGWTQRGQALKVKEGRKYDVQTIIKDGASKEIYFDITDFFGKY